MKNSLVYFLFKKTNKYLPYVVDDIIFGISVPDYPSRTVESNSLRSFWNFSIFCLLYTVDAGYKNPSPIYRIICILFIELSPDIRTFHAGYKNIPDIRTLYWKTVAIYHTYFMPVIRTCSQTVNIAFKNILIYAYCMQVIRTYFLLSRVFL